MRSVLTALLASAFGLASGILCAKLLTDLSDTLYFLGVVFGAMAMLGLSVVWRPGFLRALAAVAIIGVAWPAAHSATIMSHDTVAAFFPGNGEAAYRAVLQVGNLIGGTLTVIAIAIAARTWPGFGTFLGALVVGGIVAVISVISKEGSRNGDINPYILLPAWQMAVLYAAVLSLDRKRRRRAGLEETIQNQSIKLS